MAILTSKKTTGSTSLAGPVRLSTDVEASDGLRDDLAVTPAGLKAALDALVDGAPAALDTLNELAAAMNDDANFFATVNTELADLQTQINTLAGGNIGGLQTEIDDTQTGAGLASDGSYTAPSTSNYLSGATSLKDADSLLDAQIAINTAAIATMGTSQTIANLQSELDDTQASVGLQTDGTLGTWANTNYYSASATIKEAVEGVDSQVATNTAAIAGLGSSSAITALQSELDDTQSAVGLQTDGTLGTWASTNYYSASASIKGAIEALDGQVSGNASDILTVNGVAVQAQSDNTAQNTAVGLSSTGTYVSRSTSTNYLGSATSIVGEITALDTQVKSNADAISSNDTDIAANVSAIDTIEASVGLNTDGSYSAISGANYATSSSTLKAAVGQLDTQLKSTQDDLDTLETTVSNLQTGAPNQSEVDAIEASVGINADGSFSANTSGNYISTATSVRGEINALDVQLDTTQSDLDTAEAAIATLQSDVSGKASSTSVSTLQSEVDTTQTSIGINSDGSFTANSGGNYIQSATSVRGEINALDTQVSTNAGDISNLSSTVSTLTSGSSSNASDIASLQSEVDATQLGAGLGTTGAYAANSGSNYLTAATSLKDADNKLDAQIKTNADNIALKASSSDLTSLTSRVSTNESDISTAQSDISQNTSDIAANLSAIQSNDSDISSLQSGKADTSVTTALQSELDATQTGAGLSSAGAYSAPTSSNYLSTATSLKGADSLLDTQIKTNADAIAVNASDIAALSGGSGLSGIQTELDDTQTGAGLSSTGAYSANSSSNYLTAATSLKDADDKLDAQVKTNADAISAESTTRASAISSVNSTISTLQSEVDATQTGAGLTSAGAYVANSGANYISSVSSLKAADDALDTQIKTNADNIASNDSDISSLQSDVATKASSSTVSALQTEVDAIETGVGLNSDGSYTALTGNYNTASTLKGAVSGIDTQVKTNADNIASNDTDIATNVSAIDTIEASVGLSTAGAYVGRSGSNYLDTASSVVGEATLLDAQVKTNADAIALKASSSSVSALQTEVDSVETAVGLASDGTFSSFSGQNYINSATTIKGAIELLDAAIKSRQDNIDSEATTRAADDTTLSGKIDTVEASVGLQPDGSLSITGTNYLNSSSTVVAALDTLDTNQKYLRDVQDNLRGTVGSGSTGLLGTFSSTNYIGSASSLKAAIEALDTQVSSNASSISSLGSSNIAALQTELDDTQTGVGLASNGDYVSRSGTNYLDSATNVVGEITALDTQVKTNADNIATKANSTTVSALDLRLTQIEQAGGGLWMDDSNNDEVYYGFALEDFKSHIGPFEVKLGGANGYIRALVASSSATTDLIMYDTVAERDGDRHFDVHPTTGDVIFKGKYA